VRLERRAASSSPRAVHRRARSVVIFLGDDDESNGVFFVLSQPRPSTASSSDPSSRASLFIASSHRAAPRLASPLTPRVDPSLPPSLRSVSETATWDEFVALIRARLQLENVRAIYHASTMTPLTSMNDLQDIEDLVVDGDEAASVSIPIPATSTGGSNGGAAAAGAGAAAKASGKSKPKSTLPRLAPKARDTPLGRKGRDGEDPDGGDKYKKRASVFMQFVQKIAPSWGGALEAQDALDALEKGASRAVLGTPGRVGGVKSRSRRGRRGRDPRSLIGGLAIACSVATMVYLYNKLGAATAAAGGGP
tara:strand:+ start:453 stop:1373 length:921 start_codon:yes stop_codon:yes gene_type:complete